MHRICAVSERWLELCSCGIVLCLISHEVQFVADVMIGGLSRSAPGAVGWRPDVQLCYVQFHVRVLGLGLGIRGMVNVRVKVRARG